MHDMLLRYTGTRYDVVTVYTTVVQGMMLLRYTGTRYNVVAVYRWMPCCCRYRSYRCDLGLQYTGT